MLIFFFLKISTFFSSFLFHPNICKLEIVVCGNILRLMRRLILVLPSYAEAQTYFPTSYICRSTDWIPRRKLMVGHSVRSPVSVFSLRNFSSLCTMASRKLFWKMSLKQNIHFTDKKKGTIYFYYLCGINTSLFERN